MYEVRTAVSRGAGLLDRLSPGWHQAIDLDRLDIGAAVINPNFDDSCGCVLAQLSEVGSYYQLAEEIFGHGYHQDVVESHGFDMPMTPGAREELNEEWRHEINRRRHSDIHPAFDPDYCPACGTSPQL